MDSRTEKALSVVLSHDREWRLQKLEEENTILKTKLDCFHSFVEEFEHTFELAKQRMQYLQSPIAPITTTITDEMEAFARDYRRRTNYMLNFNGLHDVLQQQKKAHSVLHMLQDIMSMSTSTITCPTCQRIITRSVLNPFSIGSTFYHYDPENFFGYDIHVSVYLPDLTRTMSYGYWRNALDIIQEAVELYRDKMNRYERNAHGTCTMMKPIIYETKDTAPSNHVAISIEELMECQRAVQKKTVMSQLKQQYIEGNLDLA